MAEKTLREVIDSMMTRNPSLKAMGSRAASEQIYKVLRSNEKHKGTNPNSIRRIIQRIRDEEQRPYLDGVTSDKKRGKFNWREVTSSIQDLQEQLHGASSTQNIINIDIKTRVPIAICSLGDLHMGSWATDYDLLKSVTDEIKHTPNLYVILEGDLLQMSIKLRNVLEVSDNGLPPRFQMMFLEDWLKEIEHKVLWSGWDNHSVMREEAATGVSVYERIFSKNTIFHNGIAHADVKVGEQTYKIAAAHFFRGRSIENPCHGQMRYMRREGIDREICFAADSHVPGLVQYVDGAKTRVAINCGSLQTNSGYAKRFFSLTTHPVFPCVELNPSEHSATPYWSISRWIEASKRK